MNSKVFMCVDRFKQLSCLLKPQLKSSSVQALISDMIHELGVDFGQRLPKFLSIIGKT
jgi:hypothetical protein